MHFRAAREEPGGSLPTGLQVLPAWGPFLALDGGGTSKEFIRAWLDKRLVLSTCSLPAATTASSRLYSWGLAQTASDPPLPVAPLTRPPRRPTPAANSRAPRASRQHCARRQPKLQPQQAPVGWRRRQVREQDRALPPSPLTYEGVFQLRGSAAGAHPAHSGVGFSHLPAPSKQLRRIWRCSPWVGCFFGYRGKSDTHNPFLSSTRPPPLPPTWPELISCPRRLWGSKYFSRGFGGRAPGQPPRHWARAHWRLQLLWRAKVAMCTGDHRVAAAAFREIRTTPPPRRIRELPPWSVHPGARF